MRVIVVKNRNSCDKSSLLTGQVLMNSLLKHPSSFHLPLHDHHKIPIHLPSPVIDFDTSQARDYNFSFARSGSTAPRADCKKSIAALERQENPLATHDDKIFPHFPFRLRSFYGGKSVANAKSSKQLRCQIALLRSAPLHLSLFFMPSFSRGGKKAQKKANWETNTNSTAFL